MLDNLLQVLHERNIKLHVVDGKLKVFDVDGNLDNDLLAKLRGHKEDLLAIFGRKKGFTPSDFPFVELTQEQLDNIESSYQEVENIYPAVPMQQGMLFHGFEDGTGKSYTSQTIYKLRGQLDDEKFHQAWQMVAKRHDTFRTCFVGFETQTISQLVLGSVNIPFDIIDWRDLEPASFERQFNEFKKADKDKGFDFTKAPLMRFTKVCSSAEQFYLVWTKHHSLLDGWCQSIVFKEVMQCYDHLCIQLPLTLKDTPSYQNYIQWLVAQDKNSARNYWNDYLESFNTPTPLVVDEQITLGAEESQVGRFYFKLDKVTTEKLRHLATEQGVTINTVFQAGWSFLLSCYSGQSDIVFGATVSGRPAEVSGVESMVGLFINSLPVRVNFAKFSSVAELLTDLHRSYAQSNVYSYFPLNEIQRDSEISNGKALFDSLVIYSNFAELDSREVQLQTANDLILDSVQTDEHTNYGLTFNVTLGESLAVRITYPRNRFSENVLSAMSEHLCNILTSMSDGFEQSLGQLRLLNSTHLGLLSEALLQTQIAERPKNTLHGLFEKQCERVPDTVAIRFFGRELSYARLNEKANQLAHLLVEKGVQPGDNVALCLERCEDIPVSILAVMKVGAAYVPLDRFYPRNRFQSIFVEADVKHLVVHNELQMLPGLEGPNAIAIDHPDVIEQLEKQPVTNLEHSVSLEDRAYIIFTSGSSGRPKGVEVSHGNICHFADAFIEQLHALGLPANSGWLWHVSYTFDASLKSMALLCSGGTITMASEAQYQDPMALLALLRDSNIKVFNGIPQLVELMIKQFDDSDKYHLILSGDAISEQIYTRTLDYIEKVGTRAINAYGPTELTVNIAYTLISKENDANQIGPLIRGAYPIIASSFGNILPKGIPGELCVTGASVCKRYVNNPEFNVKAFCEFSLLGLPSRFYKTGDRVVLQDDDSILYLGREDGQVKIRGFRIELEEVRLALAENQMLDAVYVTVLNDNFGHKYLVAYCTLKGSHALQNTEQQGEQIRQDLALRIPEYMVPSHIVLLQDLPKTLAGKINKAALPNPLEVSSSDDVVGPKNAVEKTLHKIWCDVLGRDNIGINDNFFTIGGDSIISMQIMAMAKRQGIAFSVRQLLIGQSIRGLAKMMESEHLVAVQQKESEGFQTLLPIQQRFFEIDPQHVDHYNQSLLLTVPVSFNFSLLIKAVEAILVRHDVLRLKFFQENTKWYSNYRPLSSIDIHQHCFEQDIQFVDDMAMADFMWKRGEVIQASLDIAAGLLFKVVYFNRGTENSGRVMLCLHHLVSDNVSKRILMQDFSLAMNSLEKGEAVRLADKTTSYQQWTKYLIEGLESGTFDQDRHFWLNNYVPVATKLPDESQSIHEPDPDNFEFVELVLPKQKTPGLAFLEKSAVEDALLSALMYGLANWSGQSRQHVDMESHGRIALADSPDVSETMGWFTSVYPMSVDVSQRNPEQVHQAIKTLRSEMPNSGIGFGLFKYLANDVQMREHLKGCSANVVFNFIGDLQSQFAGRQMFDIANENVGPQYDLERHKPYQLIVNAFMLDGAVHMQFNYNNTKYSVVRIKALTVEIQHALEIILGAQQSNDAHLASKGLAKEITVEQDNILVELNQSNIPVNLFCIHPIGGYANHYEALSRSMTDTCQMVGIQAPDIFSDYQTDCVETLAAYYIDLIKRYQKSGPYHFLGWSAGARIAYEMATQLENLGEKVGFVGIMDQSPSETQQSEVKSKYIKVEKFFGERLKVDWADINLMPADRVIESLSMEVKCQGLAPKGLTDDQVKNYIRFLITFPQAMDRLVMKPSSLNLNLYKALDDAEAQRYDLNQYYNWDSVTSGNISVKRVAGNHSNMIERPYVDSLVEPLKADLTAAMHQVA